MYLHIGENKAVSLKNIIGIMDLETTTISKISKEFLKTAEDEGFIKTISNDLPKTFIITEEDKKSKIYLSPISTATLFKRAKDIKNILEI